MWVAVCSGWNDGAPRMLTMRMLTAGRLGSSRAVVRLRLEVGIDACLSKHRQECLCNSESAAYLAVEPATEWWAAGEVS